MVDDEAVVVHLAVEAPVGNAQQPQLPEADRAAAVPGIADHPLAQLRRDRLRRALETRGGESEEGEAECRSAKT